MTQNKNINYNDYLKKQLRNSNKRVQKINKEFDMAFKRGQKLLIRLGELL